MRVVKIPVWVWIIIGVLILAIVIFFGFLYRPVLVVAVEPKDAQIRIGDLIGNGELKATLSPGQYLLEISALGFIDLKENISLRIAQRKKLVVNLKTVPKPVKLSDHQAQFVVFDDKRESLLYLEPNDRTIYRLFLKNLEEPVIDHITPSTIENVEDLNWSPDRQLAFFKKDGKIFQYDFKRYDLINQEIHQWPEGVGSIDWRHDNQKVAYYYATGKGEKSLIRATKDNGEAERIFNFIGTDIDNPKILWSDDDKSVLILTNRIYVLDVFSKAITQLKTKSLIKQAKWLPDSERILFVTDDNQLGLVNKDGVETSLNRDGLLERLTVLPDSSGLIITSSRGNDLVLERLNFNDLTSQSFIFDTDVNLFPINLLLTTDNSRLFFTSQGNIYTLDLVDGRYQLD